MRVRGLEPPRELAPNSPSSWRVYLIPPHPHEMVPVLTGTCILVETAPIVKPPSMGLDTGYAAFRHPDGTARAILRRELPPCKVPEQAGASDYVRIDTPTSDRYNWCSAGEREFPPVAKSATNGGDGKGCR